MTQVVLAAHQDVSGTWTFDDDVKAAALTAAVAGSIPASPPAAWFDKSTVPPGAPLTFTDEGRVYGLLAPENVAHIGRPGKPTFAPKSKSGYKWFHTGEVRCDDGSRVSTGRITMLTGHENDPYADAQTAAAHYDNTGTAIADIVAWDSPEGVMCAGAARPGLTAEQIRMAMASPASGDWRPINGGRELEMVAALLVNTAGFPVAREALAASGEIASLVASGGAPPTITIRTTTTEENPVSETVETTPNTVTENAEAVVAAAPAPVFDKDQVVRIPVNANVGLVASVEDGRAIVQVEVPVEELADAGPEARQALSASVRERLMDSKLSQALGKIEELQSSMSAMVASAQAEREAAEAKLRGVDALSVLDGIPAGQ